MSSYGLTASGAEQKHVTLPMDFRSLPETGHLRYGDPTARFAPKATFTIPSPNAGLGGKRNFSSLGLLDRLVGTREQGAAAASDEQRSCQICAAHLFIEPNVLHAPAVIDAVHLKLQALQLGRPTCRFAHVEEDRARDIFLSRSRSTKPATVRRRSPMPRHRGLATGNTPFRWIMYRRRRRRSVVVISGTATRSL